MNEKKTQNVTLNANVNIFWTLLQIVFITLKLCKVISWSWWLVMLPSLIGAGMIILILIIVGLALVIKKRKEE